MLGLIHIDERTHPLATSTLAVFFTRLQPLDKITQGPLRQAREGHQHLQSFAQAARHGRTRLLFDFARDEAESWLVDEQLVLPLDRQNIIVTQDRPERSIRCTIDPNDGRAFTQARKLRIECSHVAVKFWRRDIGIETGTVSRGHAGEGSIAAHAISPAVRAVSCAEACAVACNAARYPKVIPGPKVAPAAG
jgi:hypothetical protein